MIPFRSIHNRALLFALVAATAHPVGAAVVGEDSFTYPDGPLHGLNGGSGWDAAWVDDGDARG